MGKKAKLSALAPNESKAIARNLRVSPRKLNLVAASIRGMKVSKALYQLNFSPKRIAVDVKKALQSAIANAENNQQLDIDRLIVKEAYVGNSFAMRRFHARGRGRASPVEKPFAHLTVIVAEANKEAKATKQSKKTAGDKA